MPPQDGSDTALTQGVLRITDDCVFVDRSSGRVLLLWPADRTEWDGEARSITFDNVASQGDPGSGKAVTVADGARVSLGGSGGTIEEGQTTEEWAASRSWVVAPDPSCRFERWWSVGDLTR